MENLNQARQSDLIERLKILEYAIRKSMAVREDQEEAAELQHMDEAERCGISMADVATKGELLGAVQTLTRATQAKAAAESSTTTPKK